MSEFLRTLGYDPFRYWLLAWTCFLFWALSAALPWDPRGPIEKRAGSPLLFSLFLLLALVAFRWPTLLYKPVNPDEPQFLAGALTMVARHEFWFSDAMTSGPLVMSPLTLPALFGQPIDYVSGRVIALLLNWGTVLCMASILRHMHGERLGRLLVAPLACFMIFLNFWDFTAYASECCPLFLCSIAAWLSLTSFDAGGTLTRRGRLALAGGILGILAFSKLQALPLGAIIGIFSVVLVFLQPGGDWRRRSRDAAALIGAAVAGFSIFAAWAWSSGNGPHLVMAYLQHNLFYAQSRAVPWPDSLSEITYLTGFSWGFASFHFGLLSLLIVGLLALRRLPPGAGKLVAFALCLVAAAYYAMLAPGRPYPHYLSFLTMPLGLAAGLLFGFLLRLEGNRRALSTGLVAFYVVAGVGGQAAERLGADHSLLRLVPPAGTRANIVGAINRLKQPGDALTVWGWRPELNVECQLPQGTRESHTERQMKESPQRDYFRSRFLQDLHDTRPAFVVDAVASGGFLYQDRAASGLETFGELNRYVLANYQLLGEFDSFRLYVRRDRVPRAAR